MITRGKYTLLTNAEFCTTLFAASMTDEEKNVQGSIPTKTISGYGAATPDGS